MKCEKCNDDIDNLTELVILFDIRNPKTMKINCKNSYNKLSIADTSNFKEGLHKALDKALSEIATKIFMRKVK